MADEEMSKPDSREAASPHRQLLRTGAFLRLWTAGGFTNAMRWLEILVAGLFKVRLHNGTHIFFGRFQPHQAGSPFAQQPVAASCGLEFLFGVQGELTLEALFAVVEGGH